MKILAIETSTEACSAALIKRDKDNKQHIISRFELAPREHTKLILPMMDEVLDEAQILVNEIDAMAFGRGPGAFTGLRIAAGVAQGVALSVDKPVIPVSTLMALALQTKAPEGTTIIAALDARMGEVYWGQFSVQNELISLIGEESVTKPNEMLAEAMLNNDPVLAIGIGWDAYQESLFANGIPENIHFIKEQLPTATAIAVLAMHELKEGRTVLAEDAQPVYIRNKVAEKSKKQ